METGPALLACDHAGGLLARKLALGLPDGLRLVLSTSLAASLENLRLLRPEVVVIDPLTPGGRGEFELLAASGARHLPVLLVGTHDEIESLAARTDTGSPWDLIDRRAHPGEFRLRIERLWREARLRREVGELRHRASHDDRTDLLRPAAFEQVLAEQFAAAQKNRASLALILVDLDRFGLVNKRFDHTVGDAVIERVGAAVRRTLRLEDFAGRLGGDEFAVLLPFGGAAEAARVTERLREAIVRLSGRWADYGADLVLSGSFGFCVFDGETPTSVNALRLCAERALREAKRRGGNRAIGAAELEAVRQNGHAPHDAPHAADDAR
jgi:diguanylate cyclase (GGDEF)-like protein